jgi:hypothetical protein
MSLLRADELHLDRLDLVRLGGDADRDALRRQFP